MHGSYPLAGIDADVPSHVVLPQLWKVRQLLCRSQAGALEAPGLMRHDRRLVRQIPQLLCRTQSLSLSRISSANPVACKPAP